MTGFSPIGETFTSNKPYLFKALYEWILDNSGTPYLLVDATQVNVQVPKEHVNNGQIVLDASPNAIDQWYCDNDVISFSARFSGRAQNIYIPMTSLLAVYAQENGQGMAFPEEKEIETLQPSEEENTLVDDEVSRDDVRPLKNNNEPNIDDAMSDPKKAKPKKTVSHLKVIK